MRPNDVAQALDLDRIAKDHVWKVEPSCATSGEGKQRINATSPSQNEQTNSHFFQQVSSRVSPGSARTSRSRRSKAKTLLSNLLTHPTTRHTDVTTKSRSSCTVPLHRRTLLTIFPNNHVQPTSHDKLRVFKPDPPRNSRRRNKTRRIKKENEARRL